MRILVTGGAGFIGSNLVDALLDRGHAVTVIDDLSSGRREHVPEQANLIREDIRSPRLKDVFRDVQPEVVFHLAAQINVQNSLNDPCADADINVAGSLNLIELSRRFNVKKFIFSSTGGAMYGDGVRWPTPEGVAPEPVSPYGIAKFTVDQYLGFFYRQYGLRSVSLRYANVYGPRQTPKGEAGVVAIFCQRLMRGEPLLIFGDGKQTRDYVYVGDVVAANIAALSRAYNGTVNIGTSIQTSVNRLADTLISISGKRGLVRHRRGLPGEVRKSALDWKRAKKVLKWKPTVALRDGLTKTWEWAERSLA